MKMRVDLRTIKPNPMRDFRVDPLDEKRVQELHDSIEEDGFWGGVICRKRKGIIEAGAGWHRIAAAIKAGITTAEVFVRDDLDDAGMIRVYVRENTLQRGGDSTAMVGSIASSVHYLAKAIITGEGLTENIFSQFDLAKLRGNLSGSRGIGREVILAFLHNVPGINGGVIMQQLAHLKASGDYARIIHEVQEEIEREHEEALAQLEKQKASAKKVEEEKARQKKESENASKASDNAGDEEDRTFDLQGVAPHFPVSSHLATFRKLVTSEGIAPFLTVDQQAPLAKMLVEKAAGQDREMSAEFLRDNMTAMVMAVKEQKRQLDEEERKALERKSWDDKAKRIQASISRQARGTLAGAQELAAHAKTRPPGMRLHMTGEFRQAVENLKEAVALFERFIK